MKQYNDLLSDKVAELYHPPTTNLRSSDSLKDFLLNHPDLATADLNDPAVLKLMAWQRTAHVFVALVQVVQMPQIINPLESTATSLVALVRHVMNRIPPLDQLALCLVVSLRHVFNDRPVREPHLLLESTLA